MRLTDSELRDVLARAEEIQYGAMSGGELGAELEAVIGAAEEMGLSRSAVERALTERLNVPTAPPAVGALVFARSADEKYYVAQVLASSAHAVRVRFLRGSEHEVALDRLRPVSFLPGQRIICDWPWWGPWTCTVIGYDAEYKRVKVTDGWSNKWFPLSKVWLPPAKPANPAARTRIALTLLGAGAGVGALIGSLATWWLAR